MSAPEREPCSERTYAIPRWLVWLASLDVALQVVNGVHDLVGRLS